MTADYSVFHADINPLGDTANILPAAIKDGSTFL
jgi:hypothetical protein